MNKLNRRRPARRHVRVMQQGVVLLEALVGILIFSIGVLGLVGVQAAMTKAQTQANFRAEAAQLASDVVGRMWVDTQQIGQYLTDTSCQTHELCKQWRTRVLERLPGGIPPTITLNADGGLDIVISWVLPGEPDEGGHHQFGTTTSVSPPPTAGGGAS